jgi:hypothetical protein
VFFNLCGGTVAAVETPFDPSAFKFTKLDASKNREIWPARGIEDHAGALMPDFRPSLSA